MGKITRINDDNFLFFDGLLGNRYLDRNRDEMFVGLIDDDESAVSAAVFSVFEDGFTLRFIATDPDQTNKGYATELIEKTIESMTDSTFTFCQVAIYGELTGTELVVRRILEKNGFVEEELAVNRSVYRLIDLDGIKAKSLEKGVIIKSAQELGATEYLSLLELEKKYRGTAVYLDANAFLQDKYCICAVKDGKIEALAHGQMLTEEFLVDTVVGEGANLMYLPNLFKTMYDMAIQEYPEDTPVLIDSAGDKLYEYQVKLAGKEPEEKMTAHRFIRRF